MHLSFRINETSSLFPTKRRTPTFKKGDQKEIQFGSPYGPFLKIWIPILSKKGGPKWDLDDIKKEHFWANKSVNNKKLGIPIPAALFYYSFFNKFFRSRLSPPILNKTNQRRIFFLE